ncbi:hypothetical protein HPB51_005684 [Rhipicephalus microplus]|uniref:Uncharacterized protein n=1 Tax=Rhipicephalus microplus TaxID=6941 RepID=A0A9J6EY63_RHIMP|nr:hypothetical protein HPB51_005684 [Rhipicephalus microplus]
MAIVEECDVRGVLSSATCRSALPTQLIIPLAELNHLGDRLGTLRSQHLEFTVVDSFHDVLDLACLVQSRIDEFVEKEHIFDLARESFICSLYSAPQALFSTKAAHSRMAKDFREGFCRFRPAAKNPTKLARKGLSNFFIAEVWKKKIKSHADRMTAGYGSKNASGSDNFKRRSRRTNPLPPSQPNAGGPNSGRGQRLGPDQGPGPAQRPSATPPSLQDREGALHPVPDPSLSQRVEMAIKGTRHSRSRWARANAALAQQIPHRVPSAEASSVPSPFCQDVIAWRSSVRYIEPLFTPLKLSHLQEATVSCKSSQNSRESIEVSTEVMASGSGDMPDLAKCRNVSVLLDALELRGEDENVKRVFLEPSKERTELLLWVLSMTDPSRAIMGYISLPTEENELCECLVNVLMELDCVPDGKYKDFVRGTCEIKEQMHFWYKLLKTAEGAQYK